MSIVLCRVYIIGLCYTNCELEQRCLNERFCAGISPGAEEQYQLEGTSTGSRVQDLVSPFTFLPPAYDTLPKDPPKYEDIYLVNEHTTDVDSAFQHNLPLTTYVETTRDVHRPMADVETRDNH